MPLATCSLPCGSWPLPRCRDSYDGDGGDGDGGGDDEDFELSEKDRE